MGPSEHLARAYILREMCEHNLPGLCGEAALAQARHYAQELGVTCEPTIVPGGCAILLNVAGVS